MILILVIDQIIKIEVKTNMTLGEAIRITDWFYIDFIENNGMAYGMTFFNKLVCRCSEHSLLAPLDGISGEW